MVDRFVIRIPNVRRVLLVSRSGITVIHLDDRVGGVGQGWNFDPGNEGAGGRAVRFDLVRELGRAVDGGEDNVRSVTLTDVPAIRDGTEVVITFDPNKER